jgi:hypothetical protein
MIEPAAHPASSAPERKPKRMRIILLLGFAFLSACNLVPAKPEAVFDLYRDHMRQGRITDARGLLTDGTVAQIRSIESKYQLPQAPEELALLNSLDPGTPPSVMKVEETTASLQVRTLKGALRLIRISRTTPEQPWKLDFTEELEALDLFLKGRAALDSIREQAGEFAAAWRAFNDQIAEMNVPQKAPEPEQPVPSPTQPAPKPQPKAKKRADHSR